MPRLIGTYQERRETAAHAEMERHNRPTFRVFVCDCDDFECRCDQRGDRYAATVQSVSPAEAARQFWARIPTCVYVVVEDDHGHRSTVAFTRDGEPLVT